MRLTRRLMLTGLAALAAFAGTGATTAQAEQEIRIGYQKYGTLVILKERGTLDQALKARGVSVRWTEFPGGPQLLEAMNAGSVDFGTTGDTPPIFAQAAGVPLVYVAAEPPAPKGYAILVPKDSPATKVADLKGKRVALNKGSNVHYLLVRALAEAGLTVKDIEPVYLKPSDARAAFERGSVDAWVIWDPFYAAAETALAPRVLRDGTGITTNRQMFLARRDFAEKNPALVEAILAALRETEEYASKNRDAVAAELAPKVGMELPALKRAIDRLGFGVEPVTPELVQSQQAIADTFAEIGLIPTKITVKDATLKAGS